MLLSQLVESFLPTGSHAYSPPSLQQLLGYLPSNARRGTDYHCFLLVLHHYLLSLKGESPCWIRLQS